MKIKFKQINFPDEEYQDLIKAIRAAYSGEVAFMEGRPDEEVFDEWVRSSIMELYKIWLFKNDPEIIASNKKWRDLDYLILRGDKSKLPEKNRARKEYDVVLEGKKNRLNKIYTDMDKKK